MINLDFETYSEAGFSRDPITDKLCGIEHSAKNSRGIKTVGASVYSEHDSTRILCYAYDLNDGLGVKVVAHPQELPDEFKNALDRGENISAWNAFFEYSIWNNVATRTLGWPRLDISRFDCTMQRAAAWGLPGALKTAGSVLSIQNAKLSADGDKCKKLWVPQDKPLSEKKKHELEEMQLKYVKYDVLAEQEICNLLPTLSDSEQKILKLSDKINARGVAVDIELLDKMLHIMTEMQNYYNALAGRITGIPGFDMGKPISIKKWSLAQGFLIKTLNKKDDFDFSDAPEIVKQVLYIRRALTSIVFSKLKKLKCSVSRDGRLRGQYTYSGARKTQRFGSHGVQIQNLPRSGDKFCNVNFTLTEKVAILKNKSFTEIRDAMTGLCDEGQEPCGVAGIISTCFRVLFISNKADGKQLIGSDFSSIEAITLAELAGEYWVQKEARGACRLYENAAVKMLNSNLTEMIDHKKRTGKNHPDRDTGKFATLAFGYRGGVPAWRNLDKDSARTDAEIKNNVQLWRSANPAICNLWYGIEDAVFSAVKNKGRVYHAGKYLRFVVAPIFKNKEALFCLMPSGRCILWHSPSVRPNTKYYGNTYHEVIKTRRTAKAKKLLKEAGIGLTNDDILKQLALFRDNYEQFKTIKPLDSMRNNTLFFWGVVSKGSGSSWEERDAWGGSLIENIDQGLSRDFLCNSMLNLEDAGYHIVMHTHDEPIGEIPTGFGSVEDFERVMSIPPDWCNSVCPDWPIRAAGGWISDKYEK